MRVPVVLVLLGAGIACSNADRVHNHELAVSEGSPYLRQWTSIPIPGSLGWLYDPSSVARGADTAYVWTRVPLSTTLAQYAFNCRQHVEAVGPIVTWSIRGPGSVDDSITIENDSISTWGAITSDEEPLYKLACTGGLRR